MSVFGRFAWRASGALAFAATAVLAITLSGGPVRVSLAVARARCAATTMDIWLGPGSFPRMGQLWDSRYTIEFTNTSRRSCTLSGYPGVWAYRSPVGGRGGSQVGNSAAADVAVEVSKVLLAPGATAHTQGQLGLPVVGCKPVTATDLLVRLPGQGSARFIPHRFPACSAAGADAPVFLRIGAIQPGTGIPGSIRP